MLTKEQLQFIIDNTVETIVGFLIEDRSLPMAEAFRTVYESEIYQKLINTKTALYLQSPKYIYEYLKEEIILKADDRLSPEGHRRLSEDRKNASPL